MTVVGDDPERHLSGTQIGLADIRNGELAN
jgi:hypothetical protein